MKDFAFYAEMPDDRRSKAASKAFPVPFIRAGIKRAVAAGAQFNVTAAFTGAEYLFHDGQGPRREAIAALFDHPNSAVATTGVDPRWLANRCVRIDEATARKSHPALFEVLDRVD